MPLKNPSGLSISQHDFNRFADETNAYEPCRCGQKDWSIAVEDGNSNSDQSAFLQIAGFHNLNRPGYLPVHVIMCQSCGSIRNYSAAIVKRWVDSHPEKPTRSNVN